MNKQFNRRCQFLNSAMFMVIFLLVAITTVLAQEGKIKYNAVYDCEEGKIKFKVLSCDGKGGDAECTIFYINPYSPGGGHTGKMGRSTIESNFVGVCKVAGGEANTVQQTPDQGFNQTPKTTDDNNETPAAKNGQFKVGDRVQVTISGLKDEQNYQPCTIIRDLEHNSYGIGCDPWHGQPYLEYSVLQSWVRPWANATAANFPIEKLRVDDNDTVLADRVLLDCENLITRA